MDFLNPEALYSVIKIVEDPKKGPQILTHIEDFISVRNISHNILIQPSSGFVMWLRYKEKLGATSTVNMIGQEEGSGLRAKVLVLFLVVVGFVYWLSKKERRHKLRAALLNKKFF